jgi:hypothetical protein
VRPADTSPEAWRAQRALHKAMTGEQRLALALEMSEIARRLGEAGAAARAAAR